MNIRYVGPQNVPKALAHHVALLDKFCSLMKQCLPRTERNLSIFNIIARMMVDLDRIRRVFLERSQTETEVIAWCTRNLFELNLTLRYILQSDENLKEWMGQLPADEIDILQGFQRLAGDLQPAAATFRQRVESLKEMVSRHKLALADRFRIHKLAKAFGVYPEYEDFYKMYSKYAHPSSWIVNAGPGLVHSSEFRDILLAKAQTYVGNSLYLAATDLGISLDGITAGET